MNMMEKLNHHPAHSRVDQLTAKEPAQNSQHGIPVTGSNLVNVAKLVLLVWISNIKCT